ncbi:TetR/AcrR family transcriptional regulator [Phenylobacterium sp.]|uniref:TetR/AcrR family transcriptional regulator n=1 Tax=Phenylobacterium sp. TaxID=1871053 RepID=UPI0025D38E7E|nr:TetR/AcrR family transcriptional regulator [Phenylobacterium sp.]
MTGEPAIEGLRQRKRRETRARIVDAALKLFLARGYDATTVDEIAAAAVVSKRSFFDYFPSKEEVVLAWQDAFGEALAAALAARPADEPAPKAIEAALVETVGHAAAQADAFAVDALIQTTPALKAREHLKYVRLEDTLAAALLAREPPGADPFPSRLLAMLVSGGMRLTAERGRAAGQPAALGTFVQAVFAEVWTQLGRFAEAARR